MYGSLADQLTRANVTDEEAQKRQFRITDLEV